MKIDWSNQSAVSWAMVFCKIVCQISFSWGPTDLKLALGDPIMEPVEAQVDSLALVLLDDIVYNSIGSAVIGPGWSGRLVVTKFE